MKHNNTEIEDILHSFDGIIKASANPFLHICIMVKLQEDNTFLGRSVNFFTRPAIALTGICLIVIVNLFVLLKTNVSDQEVTTIATTATDVLQNDTYILASNY